MPDAFAPVRLFVWRCWFANWRSAPIARGQALSANFPTTSIQHEARHCKIEKRLDTASAFRKVELHPQIAAATFTLT